MCTLVLLKRAMRRRLLVVAAALVLFLGVVIGLGYELRREFFPEVDAGAFEIYVRARTGTRIEVTEKEIAKVERFVRETVGDDLTTIISEIGVVADWSAAYTPNAGPDGRRRQGPAQEGTRGVVPGVRSSPAQGLRG